MAKRAARSEPRAGGVVGGSRGPGAETRLAVFAGPESFLREMHTRALMSAIEAAHGPVQVVRFEDRKSVV